MFIVRDFPIPLSTNALFVNAWGNRRGKTERYKEWSEVAEIVVQASGKGVSGPVSIHIAILGGKDFPVTRDLDNCAKCILDTLVSCGKIDADDVRTVRNLSLAYSPPEKKTDKALVVVTVTPIRAQDNETLEEGR